MVLWWCQDVRPLGWPFGKEEVVVFVLTSSSGASALKNEVRAAGESDGHMSAIMREGGEMGGVRGASQLQGRPTALMEFSRDGGGVEASPLTCALAGPFLIGWGAGARGAVQRAGQDPGGLRAVGGAGGRRAAGRQKRGPAMTARPQRNQG